MDTEETAVLDLALALTNVLLEAGGGRAAKARVVGPLAIDSAAILRARWHKERDKLIKSAPLKAKANQQEATAEEEARRKRARRLAAAAILAGIGLRTAVAAKDATAWDAGLSAAHSGGVDQLGRDLDVTISVPDSAEGAFLRKNGFKKLAPDIDQTTRDQLQTNIADVYERGGTFDEIVQAIKDTYAGFDDVRAELIADTELSAAYNAGRTDGARALEMTHKLWNTDGDACELCIENEEAGPIPIDEDWPNGGSDGPPLHPHCPCVVDFTSEPDAD